MKRRVVIADDDPIIISLVTLRLELGGYEVLSATNGEDALALIRKKEPVAAILDIDMPRSSGLDVLGALKADPRTNKLPVLMLTGEREPATVMQAMGAGAADYLIKPFQPDQLFERTNRLVQSSAQVWTVADKNSCWEI